MCTPCPACMNLQRPMHRLMPPTGGSNLVDKVILTAGPTTKSHSFSPVDAGSHTVNLKVDSYATMMREGPPIVFYSITFLAAGVSPETAGDPCNMTGAVISTCAESGVWGSTCQPLGPPPTISPSPPPPPCGIDDCTCACCSNGRCLDPGEASFWAGNALACSHSHRVLRRRPAVPWSRALYRPGGVR